MEDEKELLPTSVTTLNQEPTVLPAKKHVGSEVPKRPILKAILLILFLVLISIPLAWYLRCDEEVVHKKQLIGEFEEFTYSAASSDYYDDYDDGETVGVHQPPSTLEYFKVWWYGTFLKDANGIHSKTNERFRPRGKDFENDAWGVAIEDYEDELELRDGVPQQLASNNFNAVNGGKKSELNEQCTNIADNDRFDCYPESGASQSKCEARGCCWATPKHKPPKPRKPSDAVSLGVPWCFYPSVYPSYSIYNYTTEGNTQIIFLKRNSSSYYPNDVMLLRVDITVTEFVIRTKIYDPQNKRYEVPIQYPGLQTDKPATQASADITLVIAKPLTIKIIKKSTQETLFDISAAPLIFTDQFIQISSFLPSKYLYGLGERRDNFLRSFNWQKFTMFASDQSPRDNSNLYGSHPFFLTMMESGHASGSLLLNSNAMEVVLQPAPAITFRVLGGILDFYSFVGPTPADVVKQYTGLIGRPMLPPYWGLGFHLCRFNYGSANRTRVIWQRTREANIPFDVQWNDIDYMDHRRDFTYDKDKFAELPELINDIHEAGMHFIPMLDPAMDVTETPGVYPPYDEGIKQGIFINDSNGKPFVGKVWSPNGAVWPDFTNPNAHLYWTQQLTNFHQEIPFDGLWIDMNEPSNFLSGTQHGCPNSTYENPPYTPDINGGKLNFRTVCMTAKQHASIHYNVHNLYGITETIATNIALKAIRNKRPFIISRSTFPGQGHYGGHWTGDIFSTWDDMQKSIPAMLDFSLFGIPLVGADICGFNGNTTVKLCQRWMELGAFYPFSRNHNEDTTIDQDPVALGPDVVRASLNALRVRYMLLPYLYTLFYKANQFGDTVARPLFFEFPTDKYTYGIDTQFLWGSSVMILPALQEDVTVVHAYFPAGTWYLFNAFKPIHSEGKTIAIDTPLDTINVAFRGGHIVPFQAIGKTTTESRKNKFGLIVALDSKDTARGQLYWDDGDSLGTIEDGTYNLLSFTADQNLVTSKVIKYGDLKETMQLGLAMVMGVTKQPQKVVANGQTYPFQFYADLQVLIAFNMTLPMEEEITISWS